jgi:ferredoxin-nitrite reductase
LISCAGSDFCSFGVIRGKVDAIELSKYLSDVVKMDSGKVRIYWSACIKGCGIHELGDIGLLGCKAKIGGKITQGVDILIGGKLTHESREAKTVIKAVPLLYAKYYIEELVLEYKRLKKANESFLKFSDRVLVNYSLQAISFMMSFNYLVGKKHNQPYLKIKLEENPKTSAYEDAEISSFGANILEKIENSVDEEIVFIVDDMLERNPKKSKVFSPFLEKINQF